MVDWTKGSILGPLLESLEEPEATAFLEAYGRRIKEAYPMRADGKTVLPFRRLFLVAIK